MLGGDWQEERRSEGVGERKGVLRERGKTDGPEGGLFWGRDGEGKSRD